MSHSIPLTLSTNMTIGILLVNLALTSSIPLASNSSANLPIAMLGSKSLASKSAGRLRRIEWI